MLVRCTLVGCLVFSGLSALVYQVLWTRLLGFAFGTTTEAIGSVLAIFFGGMALGNLVAARRLDRVQRPLRLYALLELGIGLFALLSLPLLRNLDTLYSWLGVDHPAALMTAIRLVTVAVVLLPPTIAMGATLPVVARGLVDRDATLGRWSAILYTANTLGAVLGAYLCGFWMLPRLGLTHTVVTAAVINLVVAAAVLWRTGSVRVGELKSGADAIATDGADTLRVSAEPEPAERRWFLAFFAISGFVAIGYEIVWSRIFTVVMEGTLYGFSTVLSAYLLGLALGSLAVAKYVDRIRDLPRAFGLLHVGIGASVALGMLVVADLPHWHHRIAAMLASGDAVHGLFLIAAPIVLLPTALFGAAFPLLIRLYTARASRVGEGVGMATAVNTAGSIVASLLISFWSIPSIGIDATLYLLMMTQLFVACLVLLRFQSSQGRERAYAVASAFAIFLAVGVGYNGVHVERAVVGRWIEATTLEGYRAQLDRRAAKTAIVIEGKSSIVTVHAEETGWKLHTNGMPESGVSYSPPYRSLETLLLGALPYVIAESPRRGLVIGFGGGATVDAMRQTQIERIEVVELEGGVIDATRLLYRGREDPLDDPRVELRINDGRNDLLLSRYRERGRYDVIASQPSHPWLVGAANLFTEEFFQLVGDNLNPRGVFSLWVNGFHTDAESLLAVITSFDRVFPGGLLVTAAQSDPHGAFMLLGGHRPLHLKLDRMRERLNEPALRAALDIFGIETVEQLLARSEGPLAAFAAIQPDASNTDDNAFVEMRLSRKLGWSNLDFSPVESRLAADAPVLPPLAGELDWSLLAHTMLEVTGPDPGTRPYADKVLRLLQRRGDAMDPVGRGALEGAARLWTGRDVADAKLALERLAEQHPDRPEPQRVLGRHLAGRERDFDSAAKRYAAAWKASGDPRDAYDAARATHWIDRPGAIAWLDQIPRTRWGEFPRTALFAAERALDQAAPLPKLRARYDALLRFRDTAEGRGAPGVDETLAHLALALGDPTAARTFADADARARRRESRDLLKRARQQLDEKELDEAARTAQQARALVPGNPDLMMLEARIAGERGDRAALERALRALHAWSPSLDAAVAAENRLRANLELPLLPEESAESLAARRSGASIDWLSGR